ncbi:MAG: hypothetical protein ACTTIU_02350 [Treponema lecithinolyticum]|uniref:hypothetical protein n=1 Tax=Treponema lecithinolyticum TaxID=53418 RepID=UPI003FA20C49
MKKSVLILCALLVQSAFLTALDWTVAACAFKTETLQNQTSSSTAVTAEQAAAVALPRLILEKIADAGIRTVPEDELCRREKKEFAVKRRSLYEDLKKAVALRDQAVFVFTDEKKLKANIGAKEKEISAINAKIEKSIKEENDKIASGFVSVPERIVLWKNSSDSLYEVSENGFGLQEPQDIQALISGTLRRTGSYVYACAVLTLYPFAYQAAQVCEIESVDNFEKLAEKLAEKLLPVLKNERQVRIDFDIQPAQAAQTALIRVDGNQLYFNRQHSEAGGQTPEQNRSAVLTGGIRHIYAEAEGYQAVAADYNFSGSDTFRIRIRLKRKEAIPVKIYFDSASLFSLYLYGLKALPDEKDANLFTVNGLPVLAELADENGNAKRFLLSEPKRRQSKLSFERGGSAGTNASLPSSASSAGANLGSVSSAGTDTVAGAKTAEIAAGNAGANIAEYSVNSAVLSDIGSGIEKKRKIMYNSYAALIVSLPASFILLGKYVDEYNSWARGNNTADDLQKWNVARYAAAGVSIGLGVNFLVQLGIYLHSVNAVLPEQKLPIKHKK